LPALANSCRRRFPHRHDLIGRHEIVSGKLEKEGRRFVIRLPGVARFRVNVFRQRGTYAIVMRVIPRRFPIRSAQSAASSR